MASTEQMRVRAAEPADLVVVAEIFAHYVTTSAVTFETDPPSVSAWCDRLDELQEAGWPFLVGLVGDRVGGFGYVSPWRSKPAYARTVEDSVYLDPAYVGRGYGRALPAALLAEAGDAGAREVIAVIAPADTVGRASVALHASAGFATVGVLKNVGYKHDQWLGTTLMQASLIDASQSSAIATQR